MIFTEISVEFKINKSKNFKKNCCILVKMTFTSTTSKNLFILDEKLLISVVEGFGDWNMLHACVCRAINDSVGKA